MEDNLLFKYRHFNENTLAIFINCELYFPKTKEFNDPFDGQIDLFAALKSFAETEDNRLESATENLVAKKICKEANAEINNAGILSLSEVENEILMWSHYSDDHKGICIGFDKNGLIEDFCTQAHPVDYDIMYKKPRNAFENLMKEYIDSGLSPFQHLQADVYQILIQYKHENWQYEKEIRFLQTISGVYKFSPHNMKRVFYGIRTPSKHKILLNNLIIKNCVFQHLSQYQMKRKPGELHIDPEPLNEADLGIDGDGMD